MSSRFKRVDGFLEITWKIATLQYIYEYLFSRTTQFVLFSPILLPLSLALAVLTIYLALGVVFVVSGLVALGVFSISSKLSNIILTGFALYIIYKIIFAAISFVKSKLGSIVYSECKNTAMEKFHRVTSMFRCKGTYPSNCVTYKCGRFYEKIQKAAKGYQLNVYRPVRAAVVGYILDIIILMYENLHNLHHKIGQKLLWPCGLRGPSFVVCDQTNQTIPRDEYINIVGDDKTYYRSEGSTEIDLPVQTSRELAESLHERRFPLPIATQEDVEEIWRETKKMQELHEARLQSDAQAFYQNE